MIKRAIPLQILLVDDERHMQKFIAGILSTLVDCSIAFANDGAEAIAYCRDSAPDLAILDINMPRVDGIRALATIRGLKPDMPIVMLTSISDEQIVEECLDKGASYFIRKEPFEDHLRMELGNMLADFFPETPEVSSS